MRALFRSADFVSYERMKIRTSLPYISLAVACFATPIWAQEGSAADTAAARDLGIEGMRLAEAGNCSEAIEKLQRSEKIFHAPSVLAKLGECQVKVGKLVEGSESLNRVVRENLGPNPPAPFVAAQERAQALLAEVKPRIGRLKIAVAAPIAREYTVTMDGITIPSANLNVDRPVDPGSHDIQVRGAVFKPASAKVTVEPGKNDSIAISLEVDQAALAEEQRKQDEIAARNAPANHTPALISFGVAGGLGVGALITGLVANAASNKVEQDYYMSTRFGGNRDELDSAASRAGTFGTITDVLLVGTVAAAGVGVYFLLSPPRKSATPAARLTVEPSRISLGGSF